MRTACKLPKATNTLIIYNTYWFSTATMIARMCPNVTLYVHRLSCLTPQMHVHDKISQCCVFLCRIFLWRWPKKAKHVRGFLCDCILLCLTVVQLFNKLHGTWIILNYNISLSSSESFIWKSSGSLICPVWRRKWVWNIGRMVVTGENRSTRKETCASATLSTTHLRWIGPELKPGLSSVNGRRLTTWAKARRYIPEIHQSSVQK